MPSRSAAPVVALLLAGFALRFLYLLTPGLDSDQAIFGLMAVHILRGEFPVFQWGYHYMGTIESIVAAPIMLLLGPTRLALDLSPTLFSLLFAYAAYRLAREAAGQRAGLWALAFACFPPIYLVWTAVVARGAYSETLALGTLACSFALRAVDAETSADERRALIGAGAALGLSFWTHLNTVIYGTAILAFWLIEKPRLVLQAIPWAGGAFMLASAPFWYVSVLTRFDTLFVVGAPPPPFRARLVRAIVYRLPIVLGIRLDGGVVSTWPGGIAWSIAAIQAGAVGLLLRSAWRTDAAPERRAARLLLLFTTTLFAVYLISPFSGADTQRYLVPFYTVLAVAPALLVVRVGQSAPGLAAALGIALVVLQLVPTIREADALAPEDRARYHAERASERKLFDTLESLDLRAVYADSYWDGARFTFDARERVIFANPFDDRSHAYLDAADGTDRPAFLFHEPTNAAAFEQTLALAGAHYTKRNVEGYLVYSDIVPLPRGGAEIPIVAASASQNPLDVALAFDRDAATRWTSLAAQRPGLWFQVDLGAEHEIAEVVLWPRFTSDVPRGLRLDVSTDGTHWTKATEANPYWGPCSWGRGRPLPSNDGWVVARFAPVAARYVRVVELGRDGVYAWSIAEMHVRAPAAHESADLPALPTEGRVLADPVLAARTPNGVRHWQGNVILHLESARDASRIRPGDAIVVSRDDAIATGSDPAIGAVAKLLDRSASSVVLGSPRLSTDDFPRRVVKARFDEKAQRAVLDLGAEGSLIGVRIDHGEAVAQFPRGLVARTSNDGKTWSEPQALTPRPAGLFWSDEGLLGESFEGRVFLFPTARSARYVELTAEPRHETFPWSMLRASVLAPARE